MLMVVEKKPSISTLPYRPAHWMLSVAGVGESPGIRVFCWLSDGTHFFQLEQMHTPRRAPVFETLK